AMSAYPDGVNHLHKRSHDRCLSGVRACRGQALITEHRAAVLAIAEALMIRRTLDDPQEIDTIIATAPALARRAEWTRVIENAATFTAGLEGRHPELGKPCGTIYAGACDLVRHF